MNKITHNPELKMSKKIKTEDGEMATEGDWICFKGDIETEGKITRIHAPFIDIKWMDDEENTHITTKRASDCWMEG